MGGGKQEDEDPKGALEDGHHGPELRAVLAAVVSPDAKHVVQHGVDGGEDVVAAVGAGDGQAVAVAVFGGLKGTELSGDHAEQDDKGDGQDEAGQAAEGGLGHGEVGLVVVALCEELDGFEGADIAGDKAEDGHADAALDEDTEVGELEQDGAFFSRARRPEQPGEPAGGDVLDDDESRRDATEALYGVRLRCDERKGELTSTHLTLPSSPMAMVTDGWLDCQRACADTRGLKSGATDGQAMNLTPDRQMDRDKK